MVTGRALWKSYPRPDRRAVRGLPVLFPIRPREVTAGWTCFAVLVNDNEPSTLGRNALRFD
jgi:hypothetical protein